MKARAGDAGPEPERRFEYLHTNDRELIGRAARSLMLSIVPAQSAYGKGQGRCAAKGRRCAA